MALDPTESSALRLAAVDPVLSGAGSLAEMLPPGTNLPSRTLFHAGPPLPASGADIPLPLLQSASVAALMEGWVSSPAEGLAAIHAGDIFLALAQDNGLVVPLAFVAGPSSGVLRVTDGNGNGAALAALNDGPPQGALRFGRPTEDSVARLRQLNTVVADALGETLLTDLIPLLPIAGAALRGGDDLHGQVAASSDAILALLAERLAGKPAAAPVAAANQFFLNVWMASCALMLKAGAGIPDSRLIVAAAGNGRDFGIKLAGAPDLWLTCPAATPKGPLLSPELADALPLPAVGDSAVIDACGFGAQALGFCPTLRGAFGDAIADGVTEAPVRLLRAAHAGFGDLGIRVGLDIDRIGESPFCANLAMIDADGKHGLIGRGIAILIKDRVAVAGLSPGAQTKEQS